MNDDAPIALTRDTEAVAVPSGQRVVLEKGKEARITQALGGSYTVVVDYNMFRINAENADALGVEIDEASLRRPERAADPDSLEEQIWEQLRTCYDPEIPVNIVDLGLIYQCRVTTLPESGDYRVDVKMTLTAPGCGMGDYLRQDVMDKVSGLPGVRDVNVDLVWEPMWNQDMMSEAARLQLGMM